MSSDRRGFLTSLPPSLCALDAFLNLHKDQVSLHQHMGCIFDPETKRYMTGPIGTAGSTGYSKDSDIEAKESSTKQTLPPKTEYSHRGGIAWTICIEKDHKSVFDALTTLVETHKLSWDLDISIEPVFRTTHHKGDLKPEYKDVYAQAVENRKHYDEEAKLIVEQELQPVLKRLGQLGVCLYDSQSGGSLDTRLNDDGTMSFYIPEYSADAQIEHHWYTMVERHQAHVRVLCHKETSLYDYLSVTPTLI